ncbi:MAG: chemotaxis protein CheA [Proteobacteria bacterium]|nr:chemotaxis protein CheA [Pseudomonadota bacterium]
MDDLISEFITETGESLGLLDSELVKLEKNPDDNAILSNIFRVMHTIKGTCGLLGLPRLESVAHAGENVLGKIRDKQLEATPQAVSLILESLDSIKRLLDYLNENGAEEPGDDAALIARLNAFAEGGSAEPAPADAAPAAPAATPAGDDAPFPHFRGEDDPEIAAALKEIMAREAAEAAAKSAPAAPAPVVAHAPAPIEKPKAAAAKKAGEEGEAKDGGANQSIRVNIDVLETLMQMVSELVLTRNQLMQVARTKEDKDFLTPLQELSHITTELQEGVMKTRMQPIGNAWSKFPRLIRDLSLELGKKIELEMYGAETELDRQLLEVIKDPLTHMVRNSCDHGIETPAERLAAGKSEGGTVKLSAYHEGGHIIIEIIDDGKGIHVDRVRQKALEKGLMSQADLANMTDKQVMQFIFAPGFSTAEKITAVSGRGVGMDVVRTNIEKIGGTIELDSTFGKGSQIAIKIPLTLAIVSVLLVEAGGQKFALPQINVMELVRLAPDSEHKLETINDSPVMRLRDKLLPLAMLSNILGFEDKTDRRERFVAVCKVGGCDFGVVVDRVFDTEEIVVKPVASILKEISVYSGNTILGDGSVIMILDPGGIARTVGNMQTTTQSATQQLEARRESDAEVGFLLFTIGKGAPKSVPLELVSRLEEIDVSKIEIAGEHPVVQYRGDLMRLVLLHDDMKLPDSGTVEVIVFSYDRKVVGLVVEEILDIAYSQFAIRLSTPDAKEHGYLGSMVISGKSTDVVDVGHMLSAVVGAPQGTENSKNATGRNLLLVEDSPFFRGLTVPYLSSVGYNDAGHEWIRAGAGMPRRYADETYSHCSLYVGGE